MKNSKPAVLPQLIEDEVVCVERVLRLLAHSVKGRPLIRHAVERALKALAASKKSMEMDAALKVLNVLFERSRKRERMRHRVLILSTMLTEVSVRWLAIYAGIAVLFERAVLAPNAKRGKTMLDILHQLIDSEAKMLGRVGGSMPTLNECTRHLNADLCWICLDQVVGQAKQDRYLSCFGISRTELLTLIEKVHQQQSCFSDVVTSMRLQVEEMTAQIEQEYSENRERNLAKRARKAAKTGPKRNAAVVSPKSQAEAILLPEADFRLLQRRVRSLWRASASFLQLAEQLSAQFSSQRKHRLAAAYTALSESKQ